MGSYTQAFHPMEVVSLIFEDLVDVMRVRDIWIIIINMYEPNNTNIRFAWLIIDNTATYIAKLMGESFSLCFLRMTEACHVSILMCLQAIQKSIAYMAFFSADRQLCELTPTDAI